MDANILRIIRQLQSTTSVTLAKFLSVSLEDKLSPVEFFVLSALIVCASRLLKSDYTVSKLSRRLAILLAVEKLKPYLISHIDHGFFFHIHGLFINSGFLCIVAVLPEKWKNLEEVSTLTLSLIYLYNDTFDFLLEDKKMYVICFVISAVSLIPLAYFSKSNNTIVKTFADILSSSLTSLALSIIQASLDPNTETALLQFCILFCFLSFVHIHGWENVMDFVIYAISGTIQAQIKSYHWYWLAIFFTALQISVYCFSLKSLSSRILLLLTVNLAVFNIISYIRVLAYYDTIVTLKTSALVIQFVIHEASERVLKSK